MEGFLIEFRNLIKIYKNKVKALDGVNLKVGRGEFVSLVGPSGAGKSTLVRLLICEEQPTSGKITIGGYNITQLSPQEIPYFRRKIGVVFQDFKLLANKTVYENVAFALEACGAADYEIRRKVPRVLKLVGLEKKFAAYPDELSGGEKQRVSIARALVHSPKLLIADEPTGNLDPKTAWGIIDLLLKINEQGTIVILATHNKDIVDRLKKRVVAIKHGKIVSDQLAGKYLV
jgi:cell division transport system ATP-binding protein